MSGQVGRVRVALAAQRTACGLTLADATRRCAAAGYPLHPDSLSRIESGHRTLKVADLVALAGAYGVDPCALLRGEVSVP